jgi:hypothetical protein
LNLSLSKYKKFKRTSAFVAVEFWTPAAKILSAMEADFSPLLAVDCVPAVSADAATELAID